MASIWPQKLQTKFYLGMIAIMLGLGAFFGGALYLHMHSLLDSQLRNKVALVFSHVAAVQQYVRHVLRPAMYDKFAEDEFIIEAMSTSYISRQIMDRLDLPKYQYIYRRVAINARNPDFEANVFERELIDYFGDHPDAPDWSGTRSIAGSEYYVNARPVRFTTSCMHCHGSPSEAPPVLLERYGDVRGFGTPMDVVRGVNVVGVLKQDSLLKIREATFSFGIMFAGGLLFFFAVTSVFFNRLVVHNLRRLTKVFHDHFADYADASILRRMRQGDEIHELVGAMSELAGHLGDARRQLEIYAANLEKMVDERTSDLQAEVGQRQTDVQLFVGLLGALNQSTTRNEMVDLALRLIAERFQADRAGYLCGFSDSYHGWPLISTRDDLPGNWKDLLTSGEALFGPREAFVPVLTGDMPRGLLCLRWDDETDLPPQAREVLLALGKQMGIALENLDALDNLLRQMDNLRSIFSGISDPLVLVSGSADVLLANDAARALVDDLARKDGGLKPEQEPDDTARVRSLDLLLGRHGGGKGVDPLRAALANGQPTSLEQVLGERTYWVQLYPLSGYEAQGGRAVIYLRDVTNEKRMLGQMQQNEKIIAVGKLAAGLAHEINNPLGVIMCYAELLGRGITEGQQREDLDVIIKHTRQAQKILQDLLNFARPRAAEPGPCDVGEVVAGTLRVFQVQAEARGVLLKTSLAHDLPQIQADGALIEQIVSNLVLNALDAVASSGPDAVASSGPGTEASSGLDAVTSSGKDGARPTGGNGASATPLEVRVTVRRTRGNGRVAIEVADNGPGISPEDQHRIFDPFFTTKEVGKGSGMGLAVVYGLVQQLGGGVDVRNENGAVFTVRIPIKSNG